MAFKNVLKNIAVMLFLSYACLTAYGCQAHPPIHRMREATVSLSRPNGSLICAGVAVGKHAVLTNKHCIDGEVKILYNGKSCLTDKVMHYDGTDNVLVSTCQTYRHWRRIAKGVPEIGTKVTHWGHPYGLPMMYREGVHILTVQSARLFPAAPAGVVYVFDMNATHGDSGGPIYTPDGRVLCTVSFGVHMTGDGFQVVACYPPKFTKKQLKEIR